MKKLIFLPIFLLVLTVSCKKDNVAPDTTLVTPAMARDSLYYILKEWYYWYNMPEAQSVTTTNKGNYSDPYLLLDAMRYQALDRWSFVADYDQFMAQMQGTFVGHGFRIGLDAAGNARIAMVYSNSPLYSTGVRRGWIVKKINNTDIAPILQSGDAAAYSSLIGKSEAGVTNIFVFQPPTGNELTISSTKASFTVNSVLVYDTLHISSGIAGHLVLESFIQPSEGELATAFAYFKANNVNDLILDLRYNSGGLLSGAQSLASYIAGNAHVGETFLKFQYNTKHPEQNFSYPFRTTTSPLSLTRLVVITTRSTASASETVINGLKPVLANVVCIGDTTDGKPTGMNGWDIGKKYFMWPVTFKTVNSLDQGEYFDGIFPAKVLTDDITHDFSDRRETCLNEAIHYLETGSVSSRSFNMSDMQPFKRSPQLSEKPKWMNNAFVLENSIHK
jgi:carboxyl-terminal processing protease